MNDAATQAKPAPRPRANVQPSTSISDDVSYLFDRGWTYKDGGWIDPLGLKQDIIKNIPLTFKDAEGQDRPRMTTDARGNPIQSSQVNITPATPPMSLLGAVQTQMQRDREKEWAAGKG